MPTLRRGVLPGLRDNQACFARFCKGRFLRFATLGVPRSIGCGATRRLDACYRETDHIASHSPTRSQIVCLSGLRPVLLLQLVLGVGYGFKQSRVAFGTHLATTLPFDSLLGPSV